MGVGRLTLGSVTADGQGEVVGLRVTVEGNVCGNVTLDEVENLCVGLDVALYV